MYEKHMRGIINGTSVLRLLFQIILFAVYAIGVCLLMYGLREMVLYIQGLGDFSLSKENISLWSDVIIAYTALFAIMQYAVSYFETVDRKTETVLGLIKFFRENVIGAGDEIQRKVRGGGVGIPTIFLRENTPFLKFTPSDFFNKYHPNQKELFEEYKKITLDHHELERLVRSCLNSSEEFAIGVINNRFENHIATTSVRKPFVEMVERLAVPLYFHIGILDDGFPFLSKLYGVWKKEVGFIPMSGEEKDKKYEERKKSFLKIRPR